MISKIIRTRLFPDPALGTATFQKREFRSTRRREGTFKIMKVIFLLACLTLVTGAKRSRDPSPSRERQPQRWRSRSPGSDPNQARRRERTPSPPRGVKPPPNIPGIPPISTQNCGRSPPNEHRRRSQSPGRRPRASRGRSRDRNVIEQASNLDTIPISPRVQDSNAENRMYDFLLKILPETKPKLTLEDNRITYDFEAMWDARGEWQPSVVAQWICQKMVRLAKQVNPEDETDFEQYYNLYKTTIVEKGWTGKVFLEAHSRLIAIHPDEPEPSTPDWCTPDPEYVGSEPVHPNHFDNICKTLLAGNDQDLSAYPRAHEKTNPEAYQQKFETWKATLADHEALYGVIALFKDGVWTDMPPDWHTCEKHGYTMDGYNACYGGDCPTESESSLEEDTADPDQVNAD